MIIQNFNRSYQVMCHLGSVGTTEEYLCSEISTEESTPCLLLCITDSVLAKHMVLFLNERVNSREFTDYIECFRADEGFYLVFRYSLWETLSERLNSEFCSLIERAEIAKGLLERLLVLNPHPYFACNILNLERITVSRSLEVAFQYQFEEVGHFDSYNMKETARRLLEVFRKLFAEEEKKQVYPLLQKYFKKLEQEEWSYLTFYQEFMLVYEELLEKKTENLVPESFWFRLWGYVKKVLGLFKKILAVSLILLTIWYVVTELQDDSGSEVTSQSIFQIGELIIDSAQKP